MIEYETTTNINFCCDAKGCDAVEIEIISSTEIVPLPPKWTLDEDGRMYCSDCST